MVVLKWIIDKVLIIFNDKVILLLIMVIIVVVKIVNVINEILNFLL